MNRRAFLLGTSAAVASAAMPPPVTAAEGLTFDKLMQARAIIRRYDVHAAFYAMTDRGLVALPSE